MPTTAVSEQLTTIERVRKLRNLFKGDKIIWIIFFLLCTISVVEVYSASSTLGFKSGNYWWATLYHSFLLFLGFLAMLCVLNVPCRFFKLATPIMGPVSLLLLVLVYIVGTKENDAARWIKLFGVIPIQPSEIAKGTVVLITAQILSSLQTPKGADPKAFKYIMIVTSVAVALILPENFSTAALLGVTVFIMMFIGRVPLKQLGILCSVVMAIVVVFILIIYGLGNSAPTAQQEAAAQGKQLTEVVENGQRHTVTVQKRPAILHRLDLWKGRIDNFLNKQEVAPEDYDLEENLQVGRANIAISNGGLLGVGPGNSVQRDFLPLAFSDFIFAIITEELGWVGSAFVVLLYISLLFRTGYIAMRCVNTFPAYLAMGLAILIVLQALFNMCVAVGLAPVTGQPLPLISKGGTSSIINCIYIGMILSISRTAAQNENVERIDI